ncbi:class A beta-lactamase [Skermanella mucosa]|uniref:class A beta-lactamase n=1 Tax=Skermanella mucosa TaxID=1789672 RepID=UPI00192BD1B6|nr:class A beta-lactamase [Skermanella mucosa]UEM21734.1 class A beta-lactamase [Skermanella mucosa]
MRLTLTRRSFSAMVGSLVAGSVIARPGFVLAAPSAGDDLAGKLVEVERRLGARFGAAILDTDSGRRWTHRADERFPLCSTFKAIACGAVLAKVDAGREDLERRIRFEAGDVVTYSPVTQDRVGGEGITLAEICEAAMTRSDNTAGNIILDSLGGPAGVTEFARSLGDAVTRLDRRETDLNEATPGDPRDTTSPAAMVANLESLVLGDTLSPPSRDRLTAWLVSNKTGDAKLRAGLPKDWRIGDKTGGGDYGTMNDVAVIWPPGRKPVIVSIYMTETKASFDDRNAAIAEIGRALKTTLGA